MSRLGRAVGVLRAIVRESRAERITFMAGSIAYHAFVSLLPLLLLLLAVFSAVGGQLEESLIEFARTVLTPGAGEILVAELRRATDSTGVSILGVVLLVWGTLRIFRGIDTAFSDIYETGARNTVTDKFRDGLLVLGAVAVAIAVGALLEARVLGEGGVPGGWVGGRVLLVAALAVALFPLYYVFPDQEGITVREVMPGVGFAALSLTAVESLFGIYVEVSSRQPRQSALAGILVFLTWLYVSGLILLLGAVVNAVLGGRSEDVDIDPVIGGPDPAADGPRQRPSEGSDGDG
jgi:membrane protein